MRTRLTLLFFLSVLILRAQHLTGISTQWDDSFSEWVVYAGAEETEEEATIEGQLKLRWQFPDDWSDWEYRLGEAFGRIKMKWDGNPNEWEVRGDNQIVSIRTLWNNDYREWRISDGAVRLTIASRFGDIADEWFVREEKYGPFEMFASWEGDPRDWTIRDELAGEVSLPVKMGLVFAVVFSSTPKQ